MKIFVFERNLDEVTNQFVKKVNDWINLHKEISIVDLNFGYDSFGDLKTVVVKWK